MFASPDERGSNIADTSSLQPAASPRAVVYLVIGTAAALACLRLLDLTTVDDVVSAPFVLAILLDSLVMLAAVLVFSVAWVAASSGRPGTMLLVACAALAACIFASGQVILAVSASGAAVSRADPRIMLCNLGARLAWALALLGSTFRPWPSPVPARWGYGALLGTAAVTAPICLAMVNLPAGVSAYLLAAGAPGSWAALLSSALVIASIVALMAAWRERQASMLSAALVGSLAATSFVLAQSAEDIFTMAGTICLALAWMFLYRSVLQTYILDPLAQLHWFEHAYHSAQETLRASEDRFRLFAEHTRDLIYYYRLSPPAGFAYVSPAATRLTGYTPQEYYADPQLETKLVHPDDRQYVAQIYRHPEYVPTKLVVRWMHKDGNIVWVEQRHRPVFGATGEVVAIEGIATDITERLRSEEQIRQLALFDPLTELPNRALFRDRLQYAIIQARRSSRMVALLFIDLDRFKAINDSLGHSSGDRLLQLAARRLSGCVRKSDTVARLGGDEFVIVLPEIRGAQDAATVAQKILDSLSHPLQLDEREIYISASIGIAVYPTDGEDIDTLIKEADTALYRAKERGRNMFAFFTADMHTQSLARLDLEHDLRKAEARGEFILHYQPQIDLRSGAIVGVEALIRWQHPTRGLIPPGQFIPIAEETGLITAIASWTLRTACRQARQWRAAGLSPVRIAVNLSARQFHQVDLVADIASVLAETQIEARWLDIELTESVVMSDAQATIAMLHDLKSLGVQLSVDDFGTGYSSLSYLRRFPIDTLKIDRSFVSDIPSDADDAAIVAAIIVLAHSLKLTVIAEGVETEEQEAFLRRHGCDEVQGFLHSRPVPGEQIAAMLSRGGSWVKSAGEVSRH